MEAHFPDVRSMVAALKPSYPVYCLRPHVLRRTVQKFLDLFPGRVLYAVKCNPHPTVLQELYNAGIRHFDTASLPEIAQVREKFPEAGCYFMHPVKGRAVIQTAVRTCRDRVPIIHPVTGELLGELDEEVATARVVETRERFSVAEIESLTPGAQVQVKDRVVLK